MKKNWCTPTFEILSNGTVKSAATVAIYENARVQFYNVYPGCSGNLDLYYEFNASGSYDLAGPYTLPGTFSVPCTALYS